ncbi:MAG: phosphatase PAP2 family protein [Candidatus Nanohaloarchaea archaeon]
MGMDAAMFEAVQSITGNPVLDQLMVYSAELLVVSVPLALVYLWFTGREGKEDSIYSFATAVVGVAASYAMGLFYSHPSPYTAYDTVVTGSAAENAFPSQHATVMFAAAAGFYLRDRDRLGNTILGLGLLTGFARIYVGEHFPVDIAGAGVAAAAAIGLVILLEDRAEPLVSQLAEFFQDLEDQVMDTISR